MIRLSLFLLALSLSSFPLRAALLPHDDRKTPDTSLGSPVEISYQEPRRPLDPDARNKFWKRYIAEREADLLKFFASLNKDNQWTPLYTAAKRGDADRCQALLKPPNANADHAIDIADIRSSFFVAAQKLNIAYTEIVEMLFKELTQKRDPTPNEQDKWKNIALHYALEYKVDPGRIEEYLKNTQNVDLTLFGNHGKAALHWALRLPVTDSLHATHYSTTINPLILDWLRAITPNISEDLSNTFSTIIIEYCTWSPKTLSEWTLKVTQILLESGADAKQPDKNGRTPLYIAASSGHIATFKYLVEKCNVDLSQPNQGGDTLLTIAAQNGHHGDLRKPNQEGQALLTIAAQNGHHNVCKYIIERFSIDVNKVYDSDKWTLLHFAAWKGHAAACKAFIELGADVHAKTGSVGETALHLAVCRMHPAVYKYLLEVAGTNVNQAAEDGSTPLHRAAHKYDPKHCEYLLEAGANVKRQDKMGNTALHTAARVGNTETIKCLINAGGVVNQVNHNGETPLHIAASDRYHKSMCEYLLQAGADPNKRTGWWWFGKTPLDIAKEKGHEEIIALLEQSMQNQGSSSDSFASWFSWLTG